MQSQSLLIQFKGHVVKKLFRYLMFVILIGGVLMVMKVLVRAVLVIVIFAGILLSAAGRLDCRDSIRDRHQQIHQHDIRFESAYVFHPLCAIGRLPHHFQFGVKREKHPQSLTDYTVVVNQ